MLLLRSSEVKRLVAAVLLMAVWTLTACDSGQTNASPKDDKEIRNNFGRALTADEISKMGGGNKEAGSAGAAAPDKSAGK